MNLEELFGDGVDLGDGVVAKAQVRFRVRPPRSLEARDLVDRVVAAYDECLAGISEEVDVLLRQADVRKARTHLLVLDVGSRLAKAATQPYQPGARGGKWYRDGQGHVRYGEKPQGVYQGVATSDHVAPQLSHLRPRPFGGMPGIDRDLTGFLMNHGDKYGFSKNQLRFLGAWYGTDTGGGSLFDAFLDCAGLTRDDLSADISQLRFGSQQLTYEEAVFEFFAAQRSLFVGEDADDEEWNTILNDAVRPLLDQVFSKYEGLKEDESFKDSYAADGARQRRRFFDAARRCREETIAVADHVMAGWEPERQVSEVVGGMEKLGLLLRAGTVDGVAHVHDRPHLRGAAVTDDRLLVDDARKNPLLVAKDKLPDLTASQLMLLFVAGELHRRWDPETKTYSTERQDEVGPGTLGEVVTEAIAAKSSAWAGALKLVRQHLHAVVDKVVEKINASASASPGDEES